MSTENTEGINGDYAALNNLTADEYGKPSAAAKKMGARAPVAASAGAPTEEAVAPYSSGVSAEGVPASDGSLDPVAEAQKIAQVFNSDVHVFDGDTISRGGNRYRIEGIDAMESKQPFGKESREKLQEIIRKAEKLDIIERGEDKYGRKVAKLIADGKDVAIELLEGGYAIPYGGDQTEDSAAYFAAGERANAGKLGVHGLDVATTNPASFRKFNNSRAEYEDARFRSAMSTLSARLEKVRPSGKEHWERFGEFERARMAAEQEAYEASMQGRDSVVVNMAKTPRILAEIGLAWDKRGVAVKDIPVRELERALGVYCSAFGLTTEDVMKEGYKDPYDAARKLIENAMAMYRTEERRKKAWREMPRQEQEDKVNRLFFGDNKAEWRPWSTNELRRFAELESVSGLVEAAFANGADAFTVGTAVAIALSEHHDEDQHRMRLAQLSPEQARAAYNLAMGIRGEYDGNWFAKLFISFANGVESVKDNLLDTVTTNAMGTPTQSYVLDVLSQSLEDTIIDTSTWGGEMASVVGSSVPVMGLLAIPKVGWGLYAVQSYAEAGKIAILEDWHDVDPARMEMFKIGYAIACPTIEKGAMDIALKPVSWAAKAVGGTRVAGWMSTKTLAMKFAGTQAKSAVAKIGHGMASMATRTVQASPAEILEEAAQAAVTNIGGMFVDPRSADGKELYNLERFGDDVIDSAWTAFKTVPFMVAPISGLGVAREYAGLKIGKRHAMMDMLQKGQNLDLLKAEQAAVNSAAAWDARTRAETLGGLSKEEVAKFYSSDAKTRAEILEKTEDKSKKKWLGEIDTYLSYTEARANNANNSRNSNSSDGAKPTDGSPVPVKKPDATPAKTFKEIEEETRGRDGPSEDVKPDEAADTDVKNPPQKVPGETKEKSPDATEADAGNAKPVPVSGNTKVPVAQEQAGTGVKPVEGGKPTAEAKPAEGAKPKTPAKKTPRRKVPTKNSRASATAKKAEEIIGAKIDAAKKPAKPKKKTEKPEAGPSVYVGPAKNPLRGTTGVDPLGVVDTDVGGTGRTSEESSSGRFSLNDIVRPLSPEIDAAMNGGIPKGGTTADGTVLNPRLVEVFKGAIEESEKTGVGIMDVFAVKYARKLAKAAADPDAHQAFLQDPFSWAEGMIDKLVTLSRAAKAGDSAAADTLERAYVGRAVAEASRKARANAGRVVAHPQLRAFATFARKWLRSVFGEDADIYFIEDLTGETAEQLEVMEAAKAYGGRVNAMIITKTGNVYVSKKANPVKVLHEVFGHGTWEWMKKNNPKGYEKLKELARKAPEEIKQRIKKNYEMDENSDEFLNEVFAHLIEAKYSGRIGTMFDTLASRSWFNDMWNAFVKAIKRAWKGLTGADMEVSPEEFLDELSERFFGYKGIFAGEEARGLGVKFSLDEKAEVEDNADIDERADPNTAEEEDVEELQSTVKMTPDKQVEYQDTFWEDYVGIDPETGDEVVDKGEAGAGNSSATIPSFIVGESAAESPYRVGDTLDEYWGVISNFVRSLGFDPEKVIDIKLFVQVPEGELTRSNWVANRIAERLKESGRKASDLTEEEQRQMFAETLDEWEHRGEDSAVKPSRGSVGLDALEAWVDSKTGVEHAAARAMANVLLPLTSDAALSSVDIRADMLSGIRDAISTVGGLAETLEEGSELREKLEKQVDALERVEALYIRNSGRFRAVKDVIGQFVSMMRPMARIVGVVGDSRVTTSDLNNYESEGGHNIKSGSAKILEMDLVDDIEESSLRMQRVARTFSSNIKLLKELQAEYRNHPNKYVRGSSSELGWMVKKAVESLEAELIDQAKKNLKDARESENPDRIEQAKRELARIKSSERGYVFDKLDEILNYKVEERWLEAQFGLERLENAAYEDSLEVRAKRMTKNLKKMNIFEFFDILDRDDAAKAGSTKQGEPMSEETRKQLESSVLAYINARVKEGSREAKYEHSNNVRRCMQELYKGYMVAKSKGELYEDTEALVKLRAARKRLRDLEEAKVYGDIYGAGADAQIDAAKKAEEAAEKKYLEEYARTGVHSKSVLVHELFYQLRAENGWVNKGGSSSSADVPLHRMTIEQLEARKLNGFAEFRMWVYRKGGAVDTEEWTEQYAQRIERNLELAKPFVDAAHKAVDDAAAMDKALKDAIQELPSSAVPSVEESKAYIASRVAKVGLKKANAEENVQIARGWVRLLSSGEVDPVLEKELQDSAKGRAVVTFAEMKRKYDELEKEFDSAAKRSYDESPAKEAERIASTYSSSAKVLRDTVSEKIRELDRFQAKYVETEEKTKTGRAKKKRETIIGPDGKKKTRNVLSHYERTTGKTRLGPDGTPRNKPADLQRAWAAAKYKAQEENRAEPDYNDVVWKWLVSKHDVAYATEENGVVQSVPRDWVGLFTKLTPARYNALMRTMEQQALMATEMEIMAKQYNRLIDNFRGDEQESAGYPDGEVKESPYKGTPSAPEPVRKEKRRNMDEFRKHVMFSLEGDGTEGGAATPDEGDAHRERSTFRAIDLSVIFLMRMLSSGRTELTEGECLAMAERYDPYLGGEELRSVIAAARLLAGICREAPGVEKLEGEALVDLVNNTFENLTKDQFMKLIEALNAVQTDEWKSIAQAYRARIERMRRTGRTSEAGALTPEELQDLGVPMRGRSAEASGADILENQEMAPSVNAYNGLARKLFNHFFGSEGAPKREDYKTQEEFEKAEKAYYFKTIENATPDKVAQYRKTLAWLYGKYSTDGFLRKFFTPGVAKVVRRMVQQLRDYADTPTEILRIAERIERELRSGRQAVNPRTTMEQIRSLVEAYAGGADPRKAMKNRKISPTAQAFFDAFNEAVNSVDEGELKKKIGDVSKMTPKQIRDKIHELKQEIKQQLKKKKEEAGEAFEGANGREISGSSAEYAGNAVKALEALHRQLGYSLALQYLEAKEKYETAPQGSIFETDKLEAEFEHVYNTLVGVASRGRDEVQSHIQEQTASIEIFVNKVKALLDDVKTKDIDKTGSPTSFFGDIVSKICSLVVGGFSLKQRLEEMARFSSPEIQARLKEIFDEYINEPVAMAETRQNQYYHNARVAFNKMILKIYGDGKVKDSAVVNILQTLNTPMKELEKFSANGKTPLTRAQAMAQLAMLSQEDVQRPILELKRKLEAGLLTTKDLTEEQKIMLRRMELLPELTKTLDEMSDGKDLRMIDELVKYYAKMAPMLDAVSEKITGMPISIDASRYFPIRRSKDYAARKIDRTGRVLGAVPDFLSPRMEITTDIAEQADIFSVFSDQAEKQAHFLAFGELHYRLTALFENSDWSRLTNRYLGDEEARMLKDHAQEVCSPKLIFVDNGGENAIVAAMRTAMSITMLGGNIPAASKQPLSWSALAHEVGWWKLLRATLRNPWSKENREIRKMLYETGDGKLRWGDLWVSIQDDVMKRPGKNSKPSTFFSWYMVLQRWGDYIPFFFTGPGLYVANYGTLRSRINPETGRAFTHEEAMERAKSMVFDHIEKTQQTNRVSNLSRIQRRGDSFAKLFTQFASSPMLFFAAEARAVRDVWGNPKNKENWKKLAGIVVSNHIVMPTLLKGAEIAYAWLFKGDEPDEEDFESWLRLVASGPLAGLVLLGAVFTNERNTDVTAPTLSGASRLVRTGGKVVGDIKDREWGKLGKDTHKAGQAFVPLYRDLSNFSVRIYDWLFDDSDDDYEGGGYYGNY